MASEPNGISRRDWFAGMAMQALIPLWEQKSKEDRIVAGPTSYEGDGYIAMYSCRLADAMLAALERERKEAGDGK